MNILAIDPGTEESAILNYKDGKISDAAMWPNILLLELLGDHDMQPRTGPADPELCIENVASYGMAVGREVFETVFWIGRFYQQWKIATGRDPRLIYRRDIKLHLCGSARAKDKNIRQALLDKVGPQGTKKAPGPTYGIGKHLWSALAIAVYAAETTSTTGIA